MSSKAIIQDSDGLVENVVDLPEDWTGASGEWQVQPGFSVIDAGSAAPGDKWDGTVFIKPPPKPPVPPSARTIALDAAINGAGTLAALKAVLIGKVGARSGPGG